MASSVATNHLRCNLAVQNYDFDPDATTATDIAWVDLRDYRSFMAGFTRTVGTSNLTGFKILANSESDGSGTDYEIKVYSGSEPNALMDQVWLECSAEEIADIGDAAGVYLRYVSANVQVATGTDEAVITYVRADPRYAKEDLTADIIA